MFMEESEAKDQCANSAKTKKDCLYGHEIDKRLESRRAESFEKAMEGKKPKAKERKSKA